FFEPVVIQYFLRSGRVLFLEVNFQGAAEFGRDPFGLFVHAGANVEGGCQQDLDLLWLHDPVSEIQSHFLQGSQPQLNRQQIVITGGSPIKHTALDDWKKDVLLLPMQEGRAQMAEELAARFFQNFQVTGVVDMIAQRALRVSYAMRIQKNLRTHGASL